METMKRAMDLLGVTGTRSLLQPSPEHSRALPLVSAEILDPKTFAETRLNLHPEPQQIPVFQARTGKGILCCNRQFGKSTTIASLAVHRAFCHPESLLVVVSPTLRQSHELLLKIAKFLRALGIRPRTDGFNSVSLFLPNGSRIVAAPANPDTIRGFSSVSMMLIDEAARVPDEVFDAATPMLARSNGDIWLMSTPKGRTGFFHDIWHSTDPSWTRIHSTAADCPRIPAGFLDSERATKPAAVFDEEYMCVFQDTNDQYFASDDIAAAFSDDVHALRHDADRWPATTRLHYYIGLDLGKFRDHTAIAILEHRVASTGVKDPRTYEWITETTSDVRHLEPIPLRTPYDEVVRRLGHLLSREPLAGHSTLVVDATGPGAPVVDQIRKARLAANLIAVTITTGEHPGYSHGVNSVPKAQLISNLQIQFQNRRLRISNELSEARTLRKELLDMRAASPHHGDLAMALSLAAWQQSKGERN